MKNQFNKTQGFTLLELMITIFIAIILTTVAIPSFVSLIRDTRLTAQANDLLSAINYARSESVTRNVQVTILKTGGAASVWEGGWTIFTDFDEDEIFDVGTDELLKTHEALSNGYTLRTGATAATSMAYSPDGLSTVMDTFRLCGEDADIANSREIAVNILGRARVDTSAAACP